MTKKSDRQPKDYIVPLNINGLEGRMLRLPGDIKYRHREFLFVYGHHSSLERWWGVMLTFSHYGTVTMPDLPGFGGMDSFYKIEKKPTIDNLAVYLATFIKMRYPKKKRFTIIGMSFGFVIATRMLQLYPEIGKKVDLVISLVGFAHHDDFIFSKTRYIMYLLGAKIFSHSIPAELFRNIGLSPVVLRTVYAHTHNAKNKFAHTTSQDEFNYLMDIEIGLWHDNDVRTYMFTTTEFLTFDNCTKQIHIPLWHVSAQADHFFDNNIVEQHLRIIYDDLHCEKANLTTHAPSVIADEATASILVPKGLKHLLQKI